MVCVIIISALGENNSTANLWLDILSWAYNFLMQAKLKLMMQTTIVNKKQLYFHGIIPCWTQYSKFPLLLDMKQQFKMGTFIIIILMDIHLTNNQTICNIPNSIGNISPTLCMQYVCFWTGQQNSKLLTTATEATMLLEITHFHNSIPVHFSAQVAS